MMGYRSLAGRSSATLAGAGLREGGCELLRRHVACYRERHSQLAVTLEQPLRPNKGEADDMAFTVEAQGVALGRLVEGDRAGRPAVCG